MPKIKNGYFILGTDTNIGKTYVACYILKKLALEGKKTVALKPIATGNYADALLLQKNITENLSLQEINPFCFSEAVAPHIAANKQQINLTINKIIAKTKKVLHKPADYIVIEGAGGLLVPINQNETMLDLAKSFGYPLIVVVGIKLGCINHALLTFAALKKAKVKIVGWIANMIDPKMLYRNENISAICERTSVKLIDTVMFKN